MESAQQILRPLPRVLVLASDPSTCAVYREALARGVNGRGGFHPMRLAGGHADPGSQRLEVDLTTCSDAEQACGALQRAAEASRPYSVAFIDAGPDGSPAVASRIRALDPMLEIVLASAGRQVDVAELGERVAPASKLVVFSDSLRGLELAQLARSLIAKWHLERQLRCSEARFCTSQRIGGIGTWEWNQRTGHARWNPAFATLFGLSQSAGPVDLVWERIQAGDRTRVHTELGRVAHEHGSIGLEYRIAIPGVGERHVRQESVTGVGDCDGGLWTVSAVQDMTEREGVEDTLRSLAYFDPLTSLPNRCFAVEYLHNTMLNARRHGRACAVLHINLDGFKRINDTLGHSAGDRVLREVARRLEACVRVNEGRARGASAQRLSGADAVDTVARFGADEFLVVLARVEGVTDALRVGERILEKLFSPVRLEQRDVSVSASIGVAVYPEHADDADLLLRNAALAMHGAKRHGRNACEAYRPSPDQVEGMDRLNLELGLRRALEADELTLHYQPKVRANGSQLAGAEALLRWNHEELGMIPPSLFIPIAEETGLILPLGEWVIRRVCAQIATWREEGCAVVPVSVNVSAQQVRDSALVRKIRHALDDHHVSPGELEFEITESVLMGETGAGDDLLAQLRAMGSTVSMDDFGTGYSSLSYLKRLPIDVVKIDRSFVKDILVDDDDQVILRAIITMAHQLRMRIVAEGVESEAQLQLLRSMNCDLVQGFAISHPLDPGEFARQFLAPPHRLVV